MSVLSPVSHRLPSHPTRRPLAWLAVLVSALLLLSGCGLDGELGYQGRLTDAGGTPINATVSMTFNLWTSLSGTDPDGKVFTETKNVVVTNGLFNTAIGGSTLNGTYGLDGIDPALFVQPLYLEIVVEGQTLAPRQKLGGAAYAMTLAPGAVIASAHEGNGASGSDTTDANYATLSVVAADGGTALIIGTSSVTDADAIRVCAGLTTDDRACPDRIFAVQADGDVWADGTYFCGSNINDAAGELDEAELGQCLNDSSPADFAEYLPANPALEPGDVLAVAPDGTLVRSNTAFQRTVVGVYSTRPSYVGNGQDAGQDGYAPLAVAGLVPVKVTDENGPIVAGDQLVASSTPGHAMRAGPDAPAGSVIGKALGSTDAATGEVLMLVALR